MLSNTLVRQVVLSATVVAGLLITTTTASAQPLGDASLAAAETAAVPAALAEPAPAAVQEPALEAHTAPVAARSARTAARVKMASFTLTSPETLDMRGVEPSLYRGRYFRESVEKRRQCIAKRESEGHYDVVSHDGYFGAYQMSPALARGATWMMLDEHAELLGEQEAERILATLRSTPLNEWPRYWQDAAFSTIHNWEGTGSGASHWRGGRWSC